MTNRRPRGIRQRGSLRFVNSLRPALVATVGGLTALLLVGAGARDAWAGAPTEQLKRAIDQTLKLLQDSELREEARIQERRAALRKIADETFDFAEMAKRALGRHWQKRTKREQEEFVQLFADLLERVYFSRIDEYGGERVIYLGETLDGDRITVRTRVVTPSRNEVPVDYRMLRRGDHWLVYDVRTAGVSLIRNYRYLLTNLIWDSSYNELVKRLKVRHAEYRQREARATASASTKPNSLRTEVNEQLEPRILAAEVTF
ncbi:MAG: phospholipid-binding protein MlaC [Candidatus Methylomirabilia bacterium]